jgi:solute carrier family 13 (sodium-dependent dicarboxylate transporter), member 2/3/5
MTNEAAALARPRPIRAEGRKMSWPLVGFGLAWAIFVCIYAVLPRPEGLSPQGMTTIAVMGWTIAIWLSGALPKSISGLCIPLMLILFGVFKKSPEAFSGFTENESFLVLGAFLLAAIMGVTNLDKKIALGIVSRVKPRVSNLLGGFFVAHVVTALLVPATLARAGMFLPIVAGINKLLGDREEYRPARKALAMAAIGFGAVFAGPLFLTGHMPNVIMTSLLNTKAGAGITWGRWAWLHWPLLGLFPIMFLWIVRCFRLRGVGIPGGLDRVKRERDELGPVTREQLAILGLVGLAVVLWATERILHQFPSGIVLVGVVALMFVPGVSRLSWREVQGRTNWGTWLLLAGALSLVKAFSSTGADEWLAGHMVQIVPAWGWMGTLLFVMFLVQVLRIGIISNVGAVTLMAPIVYSMAGYLRLNSVSFTLAVLNVDTYALILPMEVTACLIAYSSGEFTFIEFMKTGSMLTVLAILYIACVMVPWWGYNGFPLWVQ